MSQLLRHSVFALLLCLGVGEARGQEMPTWAAPAERPMPTLSTERRPDIPPPPPPVPVEGGLALLALAGAGYAARHLHRTDDA